MNKRLFQPTVERIKPRGDLVSWDKPTDLGKIPGSEWVCPAGIRDEDAKRAERLGLQRLVDWRLRELGGRTQHLQQLQYPEGFHAVQIIDSETGEVRTDHKNTRRQPILPVGELPRPFRLATGGLLTYMDSDLGFGTETVIRSSLEPNEDGYTYMNIKPEVRHLAITSKGRSGNQDDSRVTLTVAQSDWQMWGNLYISSENHTELDFGFDEKGRITKLQADGDALEQWLGGTFYYTGPKYRCKIPRTTDRTRVVNKLTEELGIEPWSDIDLRLTAASMYRAISSNKVNPLDLIKRI